jgi:hypothetical protein
LSCLVIAMMSHPVVNTLVLRAAYRRGARNIGREEFAWTFRGESFVCICG